jgi:Hypothetical protein (DUF2513)
VKRDLDLVRKILMLLDEKKSPDVIMEMEVEGYSKLEVMYHLVLMDEKGFLHCERQCSSTTPNRVIRIHPFSLSWEGHEFLEASRNDGFWSQAKEKVLAKSGALSFDLIKAILIKIASQELELQ